MNQARDIALQQTPFPFFFQILVLELRDPVQITEQDQPFLPYRLERKGHDCLHFLDAFLMLPDGPKDGQHILVLLYADIGQDQLVLERVDRLVEMLSASGWRWDGSVLIFMAPQDVRAPGNIAHPTLLSFISLFLNSRHYLLLLHFPHSPHLIHRHYPSIFAPF